MAKKPSLAEALGEMPMHGEDYESGDAAAYVKDLGEILSLKPADAQALYDVICAIFKSKSHSGGGEISILLG